jgi:DNA-binding transcriptional MerR regulator
MEFSSKSVVALTGISPRQLQWWDEQGIVAATRQGRNRAYSLAAVMELAVICELRRKGFSLQKVRKVMRFLQREFGKRLIETISESSEVHLLTDGRRIYVETSAKEVIDVLKNSRQPLLSICLSDTLRQIRAELGGKRTAASESLPRQRRRRA